MLKDGYLTLLCMTELAVLYSNKNLEEGLYLQDMADTSIEDFIIRRIVYSAVSNFRMN